MQNTYLVLQTFEIPVIKMEMYSQNHEKYESSFLIKYDHSFGRMKYIKLLKESLIL